MSKENTNQAAANKAAEEGGLTHCDPAEDFCATCREKESASRQVANKAEVDLSSLARFGYFATENGTAMVPNDGGKWVQFDDIVKLYATPPATTGAMPKDLAIQCLNALDVDSEAHAALSKFIIEGGATGASTARDQALEEAAAVCDKKYEARAASGHPREASAARSCASEIRLLKGSVGASTVLTDERIEQVWNELPLTGAYNMAEARALFAKAIAREVAAQAGQVAVPDRDMKIAVAVAEDVFRKYGFALDNARLAEIINEVSPAKESK